MEAYEVNMFNDICNRAKGNWDNCTYTDKINLIKISKKLRREILEDILPQLNDICNFPIEDVELEEVCKLLKG